VLLLLLGHCGISFRVLLPAPIRRCGQRKPPVAPELRSAVRSICLVVLGKPPRNEADAPNSLSAVRHAPCSLLNFDWNADRARQFLGKSTGGGRRRRTRRVSNFPVAGRNFHLFRLLTS
jgi:hypothetical protein